MQTWNNLMTSAVSSAVFAVGTATFAWISRHSLFKPFSHGFYRFLAWECILGLLWVNYPMWEADMFCARQLISWLLLAASPVLAIYAARVLKAMGAHDDDRDAEELFSFEKTAALVRSDLYRFVRHPMYAALLLLAWGIFLKQISWLSFALAGGATLAVLFTALCDEAECKQYFGADYIDYMKTTKRFIPYLW